MKKIIASCFAMNAILATQTIAAQGNFIQAEKCECPSINASDLDKICSDINKNIITVGNKVLKKVKDDKCKIKSKIKMKFKSGSVEGRYDKEESYKTGKDICNYEGNNFEVENCISYTPAKQKGIAENIDKNLTPYSYKYAQQGKNTREVKSMEKSEESHSSGH